MYPDPNLFRKLALAAVLASAIWVFWSVHTMHSDEILFCTPFLAMAAYNWLRGAKLESIRSGGRKGVASATGYPGTGKLAIHVVPEDGSAPFDAVIWGGSRNRPALGSTNRAFFVQAGSGAYSVVLD
jgi:hypothetical protein